MAKIRQVFNPDCGINKAPEPVSINEMGYGAGLIVGIMLIYNPANKETTVEDKG